MALRENQTVGITAACLCTKHLFTTSVQRSTLPLHAWACHCSSCRRVTGALYTTSAPWPGEPPSDELLGDLSRWHFSDKVDLLFCGVCSSPMFWAIKQVNLGIKLAFFTGALRNTNDAKLFEIKNHEFVSSTGDGGASVWLKRLGRDQDDVPRWTGKAGASKPVDPVWPSTEDLRRLREKYMAQSVVAIRCHCGGVDLRLRRDAAHFASTKAENLPFFIDPSSHKMLATFDACDSCRMFFGGDVIHWTFALLRQLDFARLGEASSSFPKTTTELCKAVSDPMKDARLGSLSYFASSPDVQRYFCSRCSASIFYAVDDRPELVDIAVGVLGTEDGARAESFLSWDLGSSIGGEKDVVGGWREEMIRTVRENAEEWRVAMTYAKNWRRVMKENK